MDSTNANILPMSELRLATNNFSEENLLQQTHSIRDSSFVYKGQLVRSGQSIPIVVRRYTNPDVSFNEAKISVLHIHKNIASLFKVASEDLADDDIIDDLHKLDNDKRRNVMSKGYLIYKYEVNESLDKHISGSTLTWMQRLHVCVGVACALRHIHIDMPSDKSIIHGNIKSSKILLNQNWEPTLYGLRGDMIVKKHNYYHITDYDHGTLQYDPDPAYKKFKILTHKSDVYSFGVVLFELLLGKVASISISDEDNWSFARFARSHYERKTLGHIIHPVLLQQMDSESLQHFSETAYRCLQELRVQRPDMIMVVKGLKRALDFQQKHESLEHPAATEIPLSDQLKGKNLDRLRISLSDIRLATDNFSERYRIGDGGYGTVYRAELYHFDGSHFLTTEGMARDDLPKRKSTVAIKRISNRVDKQGEQGFLAEIEMLSKCKHQNVVSLLGFCDEGDQMILVYEHISNGSLDNYLGDHDKLVSLTWAQRMQICLDIAHGLNYLHTSTKDKPRIVHRDIKSANILLDNNWVAKIGDFGLSKLKDTNQPSLTLITLHIAGTKVYVDPEYASTGRLKKESDIYSFGVVLFEIMCGRLATDNIYYVDKHEGLPSMARQRFNDGTLKEMVDPRIMEADENVLRLSGGLNQDSWDRFTKIAYRCIAKTHVMRPSIKEVIKELEKAIDFQKKDNLHISLEDIMLATQNFREDKCIEEGRYWKQYEGQIPLGNANEHTTVVIKRYDSKFGEGRKRFLTEIQVLVEFKHKNIIALVGYCTEMNERIICYEHAPNGRLNKYVQDASLTWMQRIKICIDVATGLAFLHKDDETEENGMWHSDIKSGSILLDAKWKAKISNLELSSSKWKWEQWKHNGEDYGSLGFMDPTRKDHVTPESDWYSFGVLLLEMFCGKPAKVLEPWSFYKDTLARCDSIEEFINQVAFEGIKEQINEESCKKFFKVALQCGVYKSNSRLIERLEEALEAQEDHEIWEPKLPIDYQEILESSKIKKDHEIWDRDEYDTHDSSVIEVRKYSKKRFYQLLCKGVQLKRRNTEASKVVSVRVEEKQTSVAHIDDHGEIPP